MTNNSVGRNDRLYRTLRKTLMQQTKDEGGTCQAPGPGCPGGFDWTITDPYNPWSFTAHHPTARSKGGNPDTLENMVPAHKRCNEHHGNRDTPSTPDPHSEQWP